MYDLTEFSFKDMAKCGLALRELGQDTASMEESSQKIVKYIYEYFCDGQTGEKSCALVRLFKTHSYGKLEPSLQELVRNSANGITHAAGVKCWTLLATAGAEHYWNSRHSTPENVPIPLVSAEFVSQIPGLSAMIERFGAGITAVLEPDAEIRRELDKKTLDIFYVSEAEDSPLIPEQDSLIVPYEVRSVLGFGGMLPSGSLFAVQMFLKLEIPQTIAEMFKTLALSVKTSLLPFDGGVVFESSATTGKIVPSNNIIIDAKLLHSQIATLSQLLDISDQATLKQATRLQRTIGNLKREIADRHQTEQALRDSQAKFSGILDIAEGAIICVDETQIIQLFNQGAEKIFGYSSEEVLGKSLEILLPMSARAHHQQHISNFGKSGTVARTMSERSGSGVLGRRKNGEEFPAEASISKLKSGESFIYTVILKDITDRKQIEKDLQQKNQELAQIVQSAQENQSKFFGILDIADDAIISIDEQQIIQIFNQGAEKIFGYSAEEAIGQSLETLLPVGTRGHHQQHINNFGKSGTVARTMSERSGSGVLGRRKNGEEFPAEASISKLKSGESFIYTVILKDITDRKQTEAALQQKNQELAQIVQSVQESQAKFYGILDIADDAIISIDEQQIIQIFNQGAEKIFGYSAEEAIGQSLETLLPVGTRGHHQQHINNFGKSGTVARTMSERSGSGVLGRRKNGEEFPAEASISKLKSGESFIYTVILKDITERKLAEAALHQKHEELVGTLQQLENAQAELIQSEKLAALGQLVAGVAHEVNTPLGAIRSSVEYISDFLKQNLEKLPDFFQEMSGDRKYYFQAILQRSLQNTISVSGRERRQLRKAIAAELAQQEVNNADTLANLLIDLGIHSNLEPFLPVLKAEDSESFLKSVRQFARLQESVRDINTASDRAAKVVFALKNYARRDYSGETIEANIIDGIETVLTLYHNQIKHGVDVTRNYQEIPSIRCYFDELNQVWTNLIHNGLQAMDNKGKLDVAVVQENGNIKVSITDSGKGIPEEIKEKIFMPFFTTKPPGEGSGLGLDIVKKIVQKHQGNIEVTSVPGQTTFTVILPIGGTQPATKS